MAAISGRRLNLREIRIFGLLFLLNLVICSCHSIQDQQVTVGKLFYYKLAISSAEFGQIHRITISEAGSSQLTLPNWVIFRENDGNYELIGIPFADNKGLHFFHLKIVKDDGTRTDDVFVFDVTDSVAHEQSWLPSLQSLPSSAKDCVIQLTESLTTVQDVWRVISYLMPSRLKQFADGRYMKYHQEESDEQSYNDQVKAWLQELFTITNAGDDKFKMTIEKQNCDSSTSSQSSEQDDYVYKLKKLGLDYSVVKILKTPVYSNEEDEDQLNNFILAATVSSLPQVMTKGYYNDDETYYRRKRRRHAGQEGIYGTPVIVPDPRTVLSTSTITTYSDTDMDNREPLSRVIIPTMSSPVASTPLSTLVMGSIDVSQISGHQQLPRRYHLAGRADDNPTHKFYGTPIVSASPPTSYIDGLAELTPTLTLPPTHVVTSTTTDDMQPEVQSTPVIVSPIVIKPTTTVEHKTSSKIFEETAPTTTVSTSVPTKPPTKAPDGKQTNNVPAVKKRIPKLSLTAGKYWQFSIPTETFSDIEDGNTRSLSVRFLTDSSATGGPPPSHDYWIQYDYENQMLYAFPTEAEIGKYRFVLLAGDSGGSTVEEPLEIHVRQHPSSRIFNHVVTMKSVKYDAWTYPLRIDAIKEISYRISSRLFGDHFLEAFVLISVEASESDNRALTISWTNDTLPAYPCPREAIHKLYSKMRDQSRPDGSAAAPSKMLLKLLGKEFSVASITLRLMVSCAGVSPTESSVKSSKISVRNQMDQLEFTLGQIFRRRIPSDSFFSTRKASAREFDLNLLTLDGHMPPRDGIIGFDSKTQEIYGLALEKSDVGQREYQIMARDSDTGDTANDAFVVDVLDRDTTKSTFVVTMSLIPATGMEMELDSRIAIAWRIATTVLNDADPSALSVMAITKHGRDVHLDRNRRGHKSDHHHHLHHGQNSHHHERLNELDVDDRSTRYKRQSYQFYYDFEWTNSSEVMQGGGGHCPSDVVNDSIVNRIFHPEGFEKLKQKFEPEYQLLYVRFSATGSCRGYLGDRHLGTRPLKTTSTPVDIVPTIERTKPTATVTDISNNNVDEMDKEYYMKTMFPAIAVIVAMLLISCIIVVLLIRYRNRQDKARFDVTVTRQAEGYPTDRDAFLQKGRTPVIFDTDMHPQQQYAHQSGGYNLITPVVMPPPAHQQPAQQMHQMTPMRQFSNKPTYQPLPTQPTPPPPQQQQRRQPPPYYK